MILSLSGGITWTPPDHFFDDTLQYLIDGIEELPSDLPTLSISEHAENHRIMPPGTPRPGPLDLSFTPHLREPMDCMSPNSTVQRVAILKGAQLGFTMLAECVLCYYMGYSPADILFISSTAGALERWASRRLEPAIDSYGLRKHIYAQETNTKTRRSGDKTYSKEYFGCRLDMATYNSPASMASTDKRIMLRDETDRAPKTLSTGEGSPMAVSAARVNAWGDRSKILDLSTPTTYEDSHIYREYEKGDQRKYFMKCPGCGEEMQLEMEYDVERKGYGFKPIIVDDEVVDCIYVHDCGYEIKEYQKQGMLQGGEWKPTAKSSDRFMRSYYCPSVLAPPSMLSWTKIYKEWQKSQDDPDIGMRTFTNIYMGLPYQELGTRPKIENTHHLRGIYKEGTIPDGVLFLTGAIDVQRGKEVYSQLDDADLEAEIAQAKKDGRTEAFPRLEMEILGHGAGRRSWSITYIRFEGSVKDPEDGAWKKLTEYFKKLAEKSDIVRNGFKVPSFKRDDGFNFDIPITFIDAHDHEVKDIVYSYCNTYRSFYPSMGFQKLTEIREKGDRETNNDIVRYRLKKISKDLNCYLISTNFYKKRIYNCSKISRSETGKNRPGFMDHPKEYDERYFTMLFNAEVRKDGSFHDGNRPVESLDCKVYGLCAGDAYLDTLVDFWREAKHREGHPIERCKKIIDKLWVLKYLENKTRRPDSIDPKE